MPGLPPPDVFPTTPILDNFNRANENPATNWSAVTGAPDDMQIVSNALTGASATFCKAYFTPHLFRRPFETYWTLSGNFSGGNVHEMAYLFHDAGGASPITEAARSGYFLISNFPNLGQWTVRLYNSGNFTVVSVFNWPTSISNGHKIGVRIDQEGTHYIYADTGSGWTIVNNFLDGTFLTGYGMLGTDGFGNAIYEDFGGGNLVVIGDSIQTSRGVGW